jgi:hypothetical protein
MVELIEKLLPHCAYPHHIQFPLLHILSCLEASLQTVEESEAYLEAVGNRFNLLWRARYVSEERTGITKKVRNSKSKENRLGHWYLALFAFLDKILGSHQAEQGTIPSMGDISRVQDVEYAWPVHSYDQPRLHHNSSLLNRT